MPEIKIETEEEAEEAIQQGLTSLERDVNECSISMIKKVDATRSFMSYYLHEGIINQKTYFEYSSQLNKIMRDAIKKCICSKK